MDNTVPSETKTCKTCHQAKPLTEFTRARNGYYFLECKVCCAKRASENYFKRKAIKEQLIADGVQPLLVDIPQFLKCRECQQIKPIEEFKKDTTKPIGYSKLCKVCYNAFAEEYRKANPHWYDPNEAHARNLRKKYQITVEQYERMLTAQSGVCASCGHAANSGIRLSVDHCHKTGNVRGLLCGHCNLALGYLKDDPERIEGLLRYIREHPTQ